MHIYKRIAAAVCIFVLITSQITFAEVSPTNADAEKLTIDVIAPYNNGSSQITRSLYLPDKGSMYNSQISWQSDNESYITNSGRVIRPKFDEENVDVTLVATLKNGGYTSTKEFNLTVLSDEEFADPNHMSDEEFFGAWNGTGWTKMGKLDYTLVGLAQVEDFAKSGDYTNAKNALLEYFRGRKEPFSKEASLGKIRNAGWANMVLDDFYHMGQSEYYQGEIEIGNQLADYTSEVSSNNITANMVSFGVRAWYNESSYAAIYSKDNGDLSLAPRMRLTVNGEEKIYTVVKDTTVRHGIYSNTAYGTDEKLTVKTFGDFLGDETYHTVLTFDFSDLTDSDNVTKAELILHGCVFPQSLDAKRLIVLKEANTVWNEETASRYTFPGMVYSYNGLPEKNTWQKVTGQEGEYFWQSARFNAWPTIALEYYNTQDEEYAYKAFAIMKDYLKDTGGRKFIGTSSYKESSDGLRGGFPRTIDCAAKNTAFEKTLDTFKHSKYFTADLLTAMLKNIWDSAHYLTVYHSPKENWRQHEFVSLLTTTLYLPEFKDVKNWYKLSKNVLEEILFMNSMNDGSYVESSTAYSVAAFNDFSSFKKKMISLGTDVSAEYNERLLKSAYYNAMLYFPDGSGLQYGDASKIGLNSGTYNAVCNWFGAEELRYITTLGSSGVTPGFTSRHWPDSRVTVMRDNWTRMSPYLFTNVRGGGGHGHADDNQIVLYAYGRPLLIDSGAFSYATTGEMQQYTKWGKSSLAHNTVVINDISQVYDGKKGAINSVILEDDYNYLKQTTGQTEGFDHERAILYLKPDLWIVSDKITPDNKDTINNFKQLWHMLPNADISMEDKTLRSNYTEGANIIITSASDDENIAIADGFYDKSSNEIVNSKYGFFEKSSEGVCTFDTLLTATDNDTSASVTSEILLETEHTAAIRFNVSRKDGSKTIYYYRSDENKNRFDDFETNADTVAIVCGSNGQIENVVRIGGSYVKNAVTGEVIDGAQIPSGIAAGVKENSFAVYGSIDKKYSGSPVTAMLIKKTADFENVQKLDVAWFGGRTVNDNGEYLIRFKVDINIDEYELKLNLLGMPIVQDFVRVSNDGIAIYADLFASKKDNVLSAVLNLENLYLDESLKYRVIISFYDENEQLIKVCYLQEKAFANESIQEEIVSEYPENAVFAKMMIWKDMTPISNLAPGILTGK